MDLLLYLIKKENIDILELDVSAITDQYIEYIELMDALKFELAAEYLVMAATLAENKVEGYAPITEEDEEDPKLALIARLQEYQRYKTASENIAMLPLLIETFLLQVQLLQKSNKKSPLLKFPLKILQIQCKKFLRGQSLQIVIILILKSYQRKKGFKFY